MIYLMNHYYFLSLKLALTLVYALLSVLLVFVVVALLD
jgi:hypothetical protein